MQIYDFLFNALQSRQKTLVFGKELAVNQTDNVAGCGCGTTSGSGSETVSASGRYKKKK